MGNANVSGPKPQVKAPSTNQCSDDIWSIDPNTGNYDRSETTRDKLQSQKAFIKPMEFCNTRVVDSASGLQGTDRDSIEWVSKLLNKKNPLSQVEQEEAVDEYGDEALLSYNTPEYYNTLMCSNIGDPVEWWPFTLEEACNFNDCQPGFSINGPGCNGGCCAIIGARQSCARVAFTADPVVCCFNDYKCDNNEDKCFQTPARQKTCDPRFRDITSQDCRLTILNYCTGDATFPGQSNWLEMWLEDSFVDLNSAMEADSDVFRATFFNNEVNVSDRGKQYPLKQKQPCLRAIARNLTKQSVCSWDELQEGSVITGNIDPVGLSWSRFVLNSVYDKFESESGSGLLSGFNSDGINNSGSFYNTLWSICNKVPLLCTDGNDDNPQGILPKLCSKVTADTLASNPNVIRWCACHMPTEEYQEYQDKFNIPRECTPMCNRDGVIPAINEDGERKVCIENLCLLDDKNINITNTQFGEGSSITFTQLCPGCGKGNVQRRYDYQQYKNSSDKDENSNIYALVSPYKLDSGKNTYLNTYGLGYDKSNFPTEPKDIQCIYTTTKFLTDNKIPIEGTGDLDASLVSDIPNIFVAFGSATDAPNGELGVVNAALRADSITGNDGEFVVLFSANLSEASTNFPNGSYPRLKLIPGGFYAGDTANQTKDNFTYKKSLLLQKSKDFKEQHSEFSSDFEYSSAKSSVNANTCNCMMDKLNLNILNSKFDGSINFTSECGKSACYNSAGNKVSCAGDLEGQRPLETLENIEKQTIEEEEKEKYLSILVVVLSIGGLLVIGYLLYTFLKT